ncbi:hypothetical protein FEM48_Zijuj03G0004300 [Ziziphus jujuba var. spinosa]|uniref:RING-type domain-containing protein n=1 Tax=Ziziphus jujuba var. spinosa TaxID=714518 RepID=A0A978VM48_ZIZJJ|nr:hypothetical protein FEM48_Zijuj03G0004300 [Ziziphus jujuba var. spinosa]
MNPFMMSMMMQFMEMERKKKEEKLNKERKKMEEKIGKTKLIEQAVAEYNSSGKKGGEMGGCCSICLEDFSSDEGIHYHHDRDCDRLRRLPCRHVYHRNCVHEWLEKHTTCPLCRHPL